MAVVPGYYLVCYNGFLPRIATICAVVPGYYLVCYNTNPKQQPTQIAVVPGYYLVCYNRERKTLHNPSDYAGFYLSKKQVKSDYNR